MNATTPTENGKRSDGMKVKRIREILQVKQSTLANALGEDWNQKKVSLLEDKDVIDDKLMEEIANALKVPVEAIKNFDEESTVMNIQNNYEGAHIGSGSNSHYSQCSFNPLDKLIEIVDKNEKLYERLLQSEREKVEMMQRMIEEKK